MSQGSAITGTGVELPALIDRRASALAKRGAWAHERVLWVLPLDVQEPEAQGLHVHWVGDYAESGRTWKRRLHGERLLLQLCVWAAGSLSIRVAAYASIMASSALEHIRRSRTPSVQPS